MTPHDHLKDILTPQELSELTQLENELFSMGDLASLSAKIHLATLEMPLQELPANLLKPIADSAKSIMPRGSEFVPPSKASPKLNHLMVWSGWAIAASLLLVLGLSGFQVNQKKDELPVMAQVRQKLIERKADQFVSTKKVGQAEGEILWENASQTGVMTLKGLKPNDPKQKQYQLWIVDAGRGHKEPVDGGVFDVNANGEATVPIRAALQIREPKLFAVTEEPPGGVVVSEKGKQGEFVVVLTK
jgi:hypothetical protein